MIGAIKVYSIKSSVWKNRFKQTNTDLLINRQYSLYRNYTHTLDEAMNDGASSLTTSDCDVLGSDTVRSCRWIPTFRRNVFPPFLRFTLKTVAAQLRRPQSEHSTSGNSRSLCTESLSGRGTKLYKTNLHGWRWWDRLVICSRISSYHFDQKRSD